MSIPTRQASLKELADVIGAKTHGDPETCISGIATLELAEKNDLSFFSNRKYHHFLSATKASIVILHPDDLANYPGNAILSKDPYLAYAKLATWLTKPKTKQVEIASTAVIEDNVSIGKNASIGAHVVVGSGSKIGDNVRLLAGCSIADDVKIGDNTILYPNVSIYSNVSIGQQCIIHSGAVIGSDGFGIANEQGHWFKINHFVH